MPSLSRFTLKAGDGLRVRSDAMRASTSALLQRVGMTATGAASVADVLVANDLRGNESHGVSNMLRQYVSWFQNGTNNPSPDVRVMRETPATAMLDADKGLGIHVGPQAMEMAVQKAKAVGMGCVAVRGAGHLGGAGYHAMIAAKAGCIGQCFGAPGGALVPPTFGAEPRFGTHPIAWAAPAGPTEAPFLFDVYARHLCTVGHRTPARSSAPIPLTFWPSLLFPRVLPRSATTQVAGNKIRLAARLGVKLAPNWVTDPASSETAGRVIEEEIDAPEDFMMTPMGGTRENSSHKGYGLQCAVDLLCNSMTGIGAGCLTGGGGLLVRPAPARPRAVAPACKRTLHPRRPAVCGLRHRGLQPSRGV